MAWHTPISQTTQVTLGAIDSVYVDETVTIGVSSFAAIIGGIGSSMIIDGTVLSGSLTTVFLNALPWIDATGTIEIGATGKVANFGSGDAAIAFSASGIQLFNAGLITSRFAHGVRLNNQNAATQSVITNTGTIDAGGIGVARLDFLSVETIVLNNSGLIAGDTASYGWMFGPSVARDVINNSGRMIGDINFAGGNDSYNGAAGRLTGKVFGDDGTDTITGGIDNDWFEGGAGSDTLRGNRGNDRLNGGAGADRMFGGVGSDTYLVDNVDDNVNEFGGNGIDTIFSSIGLSLANAARVIGAVENLTLTGAGLVNGLGNGLANIITGNGAANRLDGGAGNDTLRGLNGHDILISGLGRDIMAGGLNNDIFRFGTASHSPAATPDVITDFDDFGNDRIDLSALPGVLTYHHSGAFTGAGQVRINDIAGPDVIVQVNIGGSLAADFAIRLAGTTLGSMTGGDFIL